MYRLSPAPLAVDKLQRAWTPWMNPDAAAPYFEQERTVSIGPYRGRLRYIRCGTSRDQSPRHSVLSAVFCPPHLPQEPATGVSAYFVRAVAFVEDKRHPLRKLFDRLFHGIGFDGSVRVGPRDLAAFLDVEGAIRDLHWQGEEEQRWQPSGGAVPADDPANAPDGAEPGPSWCDEAQRANSPESRLQRLAARVDVLRTPGEARQLLDDYSRPFNRATWPEIEELLTVPEAVQAIWHEPSLRRRLLDCCPDHHAIYRLALTRDPALADLRPGLRSMLEDDYLMEGYVLPVLYNAIEPMAFDQAVQALEPFKGLRGRGKAQLFWKDGGKTFRQCASPWQLLLGKASTDDERASLAVFHPDLSYQRYIHEMARLPGWRGKAVASAS
ncbi:hypothetical protein [Paracidovorax citrulli]